MTQPRDFMAGGGHVGELMRARDWSTSPLGPPEGWAQSLRTVVSLLLHSRFPMFVAWGKELGFLYNDPYAEILGAKHPSALGKRFYDIWSEIWPDISPLIDAAMAGQATYHQDLPLVMNRKGYDEQTWFTFSYSPVRDEDGHVAGMFCACTETTGKVLAERGLRDSEGRLRALVVASSYALYRMNADWSQMLALEGQGFIADTSSPNRGWLGDYIHPDDQAVVRDAVSEAIARKGIFELEHRVRRADGTLGWTLSRAVPLFDADGNITEWFGAASDVTPRKEAEAGRLRLLSESAAITESLNDVGAIVASDLDREKVVQAVTDAATELTTAEFGAFFYNNVNDAGESYTLYTISGVPREAFSKFPMPRNTEVFAPTFKGTGTVRSADITADPRYGHNAPYYGMPQGHLPVRSYLAVPVKGRSGDVIGGLFFGHSSPGRFTENHERLAIGIASWASVALENARMFAAVQAASRLKDDFLASLSHELRTPLNAILGYARMLRSGIVASERREKAIETIERNATSLTQIVEDVLDISRIVSGKIRLSVQPVELPEIVRNAVDSIMPAAEAKGIRIEAVLDPHAAPISGDPERLQQVLWNLLSNAVKFTNRGGKIQVRLERVNSHVEVTVSDTGIGIPVEFLPHVFERFRQADAGITRERGGLGLGLSIARQLTEMHGGTIEASSGGPGTGATFRVKLPLMIVHPAVTETERVHPRTAFAVGPIPIGDLHGVHVVAVDDDADALALVAELLEAVGARVTTAQSAAEALQQLAVEPPDVLVADLGMPQTDGFQLIEQIRRHADRGVRHIPAAALTAYARSDDRVKALRAGFQIHLAKPIDPAELVTTVAALARRFTPGADDGSGTGGW